MTSPLDLLAAPIEGLLAAVGSGALPFDGPQNQLRASSRALDQIALKTQSTASGMVDQWSGVTATSMLDGLSDTHRDSSGISGDGRDIASIIDHAAVVIAAGARDLEQLLKEFVAQVDALGPLALTPVGFGAVMAIAETYLARALKIVADVRHHLEADTRKLMASSRHKTTAKQASRAKLEQQQEDSSKAAAARGGSNDPAAAAAKLNAAMAGFGKEMTAPADPSSQRISGSGSPNSATASMVPMAGGGVAVTLPNGKTVMAPNAKAAAAVEAALSQRGVPYVWGGTSPGKGLDCSGLTQYSYRQAGVELPRVADQQTVGEHVASISQAEPGDLFIWSGHVAMYAGDNQLVEAGDPVQMSPVRTTNMGEQFMGVYRPTE